jgi:hypothetical protein
MAGRSSVRGTRRVLTQRSSSERGTYYDAAGGKRIQQGSYQESETQRTNSQSVDQRRIIAHGVTFHGYDEDYLLKDQTVDHGASRSGWRASGSYGPDGGTRRSGEWSAGSETDEVWEHKQRTDDDPNGEDYGYWTRSKMVEASRRPEAGTPTSTRDTIFTADGYSSNGTLHIVYDGSPLGNAPFEINPPVEDLYEGNPPEGNTPYEYESGGGEGGVNQFDPGRATIEQSTLDDPLWQVGEDAGQDDHSHFYYQGPKPQGPILDDGAGLDSHTDTIPTWGLTALEIGAGVLVEPIDWLLTAREIYNDPKNPLSYAGLIPFVPAGAGKLAREALQAADKGGDVGKAVGKFAETVKTAVKTTGQIHHPISAKIGRDLQKHPALKGHYKSRDPRFTTQAADAASHRGYQTWHRALDKEVVQWLRDPINKAATPEQFEAWLRSRYAQPDLKQRFPNGF